MTADHCCSHLADRQAGLGFAVAMASYTMINHNLGTLGPLRTKPFMKPFVVSGQRLFMTPFALTGQRLFVKLFVVCGNTHNVVCHLTTVL